jgi:hypothetical protein
LESELRCSKKQESLTTHHMLVAMLERLAKELQVLECQEEAVAEELEQPQHSHMLAQLPELEPGEPHCSLHQLVEQLPNWHNTRPTAANNPMHTACCLPVSHS